ncbi:SETMR methyltransferase, partial [Pseudoatta argentina]
MTTVRYWFNEFKRGRSSVFDEERSGCPADVVTEEIIEKDHDMILADRRTKVHEVAKAVGVSYGKAFNILHDNLGMKKLSARWVPRSLTMHRLIPPQSPQPNWSNCATNCCRIYHTLRI